LAKYCGERADRHLRRTFETNFFGLVDLTQRLLPLLRRSDNPRIVNQSSILGSLTMEEGARTAVELATPADDGPSGSFFHRGKRLPW
jgi:NAD(P)-dependent dehydrogenase (short-subunit alcohol dehydrogenase family)